MTRSAGDLARVRELLAGGHGSRCRPRTGILGRYLGDGYLAPNGVISKRLEVALDARYPRIVAEAAVAVRSCLPVRVPLRQRSPFLRGLVHSDGTRCVNRVARYSYSGYMFSNRSDDIRRLFVDTCAMVGVEARQAGRWKVSVATRAGVAALDPLRRAEGLTTTVGAKVEPCGAR